MSYCRHICQICRVPGVFCMCSRFFLHGFQICFACVPGVLCVFQVCFVCYRCVLRVLQMCFACVTDVFCVCSRCVLRVWTTRSSVWPRCVVYTLWSTQMSWRNSLTTTRTADTSRNSSHCWRRHWVRCHGYIALKTPCHTKYTPYICTSSVRYVFKLDTSGETVFLFCFVLS